MTERLSIRAYAKRIGVSHVAVIGAIKRGVLNSAVVIEGATKLIDVDVADREWQLNADESMRRDGRITQIPRAAAPAPQHAPPAGANDPEAGIASSFQRARAVKEQFSARMAKLEYERESGTLINAQDVQNRIADHVRAALDILAARRRRLAPELALETDPRKIEAALEQSDREFAAEMAGLAAPAAAEQEAA